MNGSFIEIGGKSTLSKCARNKNKRIKKTKREEVKNIKKLLKYMINNGYTKELYKPILFATEFGEHYTIINFIVEHMSNKYKKASFKLSKYGYMGSYTGIIVEIIK